ncbi:MAG: hypothetical protein MRJ68_04415 [Nitrospira sp.]|nr:hypothetical protein [Nitrospira sp.]
MGRTTTAAKRTEIVPLEKMTPLEKISELAFDMELQIKDAIGIARTAQQKAVEENFEEYDAAFGLILYRLEQIREGHALIAEHAPYGEKARLS